MSTYNPIVNECYACERPFEEGDWAFGFHEHYVCEPCGKKIHPEHHKTFQWFSSIEAAETFRKDQEENA